MPAENWEALPPPATEPADCKQADCAWAPDIAQQRIAENYRNLVDDGIEGRFRVALYDLRHALAALTAAQSRAEAAEQERDLARAWAKRWKFAAVYERERANEAERNMMQTHIRSMEWLNQKDALIREILESGDVVFQERDAAQSRAEAAERERDALKAKLETKRTQLLERVQALRDMYDEVYRDAEATAKERDAARTRLAEAEAVIAWYGDPENWDFYEHQSGWFTHAVADDNGERARAYQQQRASAPNQTATETATP